MACQPVSGPVVDREGLDRGQGPKDTSEQQHLRSNCPVDALIAAHRRGVAVRVVGDDDAAENEYQSGYQALTTAGITVITDTHQSPIQHNKFMVLDGQVVWTGSTNFTDTCLTLNANNSLVVTDTILANIYTTEFDEMWNGAFHGNRSDNSPALATPCSVIALEPASGAITAAACRASPPRPYLPA